LPCAFCPFYLSCPCCPCCHVSVLSCSS
jgi:hypothetical protein